MQAFGAKGPPQLDDQNCFAHRTSPKDKGSTEVTDVVDDHDNIVESGIDYYERVVMSSAGLFFYLA